MIKWYTCIIEIPSHVQSVQYFHTRASSPFGAEKHAYAWALDGEHDLTREMMDVPFVFEGRIFPESVAEPEGESDDCRDVEAARNEQARREAGK